MYTIIKGQRKYLSNLYPCNRDSARIVFVEVAKQPNKAAQNPNMLKLSSVTEVRRIPPTMGIKEAQIRQSKYFLQISHCKKTVLSIDIRQSCSTPKKPAEQQGTGLLNYVINI